MTLLYFLCISAIVSGAALAGYGLLQKKENEPIKIKETSYFPEIPKEFDPNFIQEELSKVQHSPTAKEAYFNILKKQFTKEEESDLLELIIAYNEQDTLGTVSEAELFQKKKELEEAKRAYKLSIDAEVTGLKREVGVFQEKETIAKTNATIREHDQQWQKKEKPRPLSDEERREKERAKLKSQFKDVLDRYKTCGDGLEDVEKYEKEEMKKIELIDDPEEKERRIAELKDTITNLRKEFLHISESKER